MEKIMIVFPIVKRLGLVLQHRTAATTIEKVHYKFFYTPVHNTVGEEAILLDILFEANHYKNIQSQEIKSGIILSTLAGKPTTRPGIKNAPAGHLFPFAEREGVKLLL